jgi:Homeodomain-like domain
MNVRYRVELSQIERTELRALLSGGKHASRKLKRAQILLAADAGAGDEEIARSVGVSGSTVYRTKRRFVEGNLERACEEPRLSGAQTHRQGRSLAGGDRLCQPPKGPCPLDAQAAGRRDGQTHRTQEPVARDGSAAPGRK